MDITAERLTQRLQELSALRDDAFAYYNQVVGALSECQEMLKAFESDEPAEEAADALTFKDLEAITGGKVEGIEEV